MNWSDDESLEGLTQVPSQKRDFEGNLKLRSAEELLHCSGNAEDDFDNFSSVFLEDTDHDKISSSKSHDVSAELFPTPPADGNSLPSVQIQSEQSSIRSEVMQVGICLLLSMYNALFLIFTL